MEIFPSVCAYIRFFHTDQHRPGCVPNAGTSDRVLLLSGSLHSVLTAIFLILEKVARDSISTRTKTGRRDDREEDEVGRIMQACLHHERQGRRAGAGYGGLLCVPTHVLEGGRPAPWQCAHVCAFVCVCVGGVAEGTMRTQVCIMSGIRSIG